MILIQLLDDIMAKSDEQHVSGELSKVEEVGTEDTTSTSIDGTTSTSPDCMTSTSTDDMTSTSPDSTTSTSTNGTTPTSTYGMTSTSTDDKTSTSIDGSTQNSTYVSGCDLVPDVDREITIEDFLEPEDEAQPENLDHNLEKSLMTISTLQKRIWNLHLRLASINGINMTSIDTHPIALIDIHLISTDTQGWMSLQDI